MKKSLSPSPDADRIDLELDAIISGMGLAQRLPGLIIYDSELHPGTFIRNRPFRSRHYSIIVILSGELRLNVNLLSQNLVAGDVLIIPPTAIRELNWEPGACHFISILFKPEVLRDAGIKNVQFDVARFLNSGFQSMRKLVEEDQGLISRLAELIRGFLLRESFGPQDVEVVRSIFKAMLLKLKQYYDSDSADSGISGSLIYRFLKLLSDHYLESREVSFYADKLFINEKHLTQVLKKKTGKTARQFIIDIVIVEAKVMLGNSAVSVKEIADRLSFVNQFHFSRFFSKYAGMSPTAYRVANG